MMNRIVGTYYDGRSSKPVPVTIDLGAMELILSNELGALGDVEIEWAINQLEDVDFSSADTIQLKYGKFPSQSLIINEPEAVAKFKAAYPQMSASLYKRVLKDNGVKVFATSFVVLVAAVALYLTVIAPFIAEQAVGLVSVQAEVELGDKMTETLFANLEVNEEKSETLTAFFEASGFESEYPIRLYYVEEPVVNAFAVPGGKIVVFEGIVDLMDSWEELAGLLGHELAHVEERHSLEAMSRSLSTYLVFSIMTGDVNGVGAVLLENTMMLQDLSNSRKAEVEADQKGFEYLLGQEVSPRGMIDLFVHLQEAEPDLGEQGNQLMEIMSTHPLTTDRIANLEKAYEDAGQPSFEEKTEAQALFEQLRAKEMSDLEISEEEEEETATLDE